ncbi:glutamine synthetase cytosolic isozyme 1-4-like isoform X3 [Euphorbia lathyris]|uniref:glutamine synthetase cytosolic isozyme 1-4-like isoform X3 n=1 Tax=Euphorbia lathyris TaxID=212925 RepID=UPI003313BDCB
MGIVKSEISILTYKRKFIHLQVHTKILATLKHQVMCDAYTHAGVPIPTNKRHATAEVSEKVSGRWRGFNGRFLIIWKQPCLSPIWQER